MPTDPRFPHAQTFEERMVAKIADLEKKIRTLSSYLSGGSVQQVPVVAGLPAAGRLGRVVVNSLDNKLYVDNGSSWVAQT